MDLRQVVAGILTITMFVMLGQMLHRDYFDAVQVFLINPHAIVTELNSSDRFFSFLLDLSLRSRSS